MTIDEFFVGLSNVDWLYAMSDAPGVYERGQKRVAEVKAKAEELGGVYEEMFYDFESYNSSIVIGTNERQPMLSDYTNEY